MNEEPFQLRPAVLSRRRLLAGTAAMAGGYALKSVASHWPEDAADRPGSLSRGALPPQFGGDARAVLALAERFPWTQYTEKSFFPLQIANVFDPALALNQRATTGLLGERQFHLGNGRAVLPWAPMFERPSAVITADRDLRAQVGVERLFIKDEGNDRIAIYGNKVRKYEFLLPNLYYGGVRKIYSHGAYGSNHCAHLALAARFADFHAAPAADDMDVVLNLYPQEITENVKIKLRLLAATGVTMKFLQGDAAVALSIGLHSQLNKTTERSAEGFIDPGGSSPLAVLGHVEAAMELARQIESRSCAMDGPPDFVFLPIGSGGTAMGLALGFYILRWSTRIVATCSQDKGMLARLVVNGNTSEPFGVAHAKHLLAESMPWVKKLGLVADNVTAEDVLRGRFAYDAETWLPGYGKMSAAVAESARIAEDSGLILDGTFSAKAFHTLTLYAKNQLLHRRRVLFWNTYQRFPFETVLAVNDAWMSAFPADIQSRLVQV